MVSEMTNSTDDPDGEDSAPEMEPIKVEVVNTVQEDVAAAFGSWQSFFVLVANAQGPQQILPVDEKRSKARIMVFAGTGAAAGAFVRVGSRGQVMNNAGGVLLPGTYTIENSQELYMTGDGVNLMTVTVLAERYG